MDPYCSFEKLDDTTLMEDITFLTFEEPHDKDELYAIMERLQYSQHPLLNLDYRLSILSQTIQM